jgi:hypothetical protein
MVSALSHDFEVQSLTCLASATLVHAAYIGSSFPLRCLSRSGEERLGNLISGEFLWDLCGMYVEFTEILGDLCWTHGMLLELAGEQVERLNHQRT